MKIIVAPDSFKGALRSGEAAAAFAAGWRSVRPGDTVIEIPLSDGGEGMADALCVAVGGKYLPVNVHDALRRPVAAQVVIAGDTAIVETAGANGIELLAKAELDPLSATSFGVGEMLDTLYNAGFRKYLIGIGGSATVDGGAGMIQALGGRLLDKAGNAFPPGAGGGILRDVAAADVTALAKWRECSVKVACDVTNVLCGVSGAAHVFGPQKGANAEMVLTLDANLRHWADILGDAADSPGDGAAGGLGFALRYVLGAEMVSGAELVMEYSGFKRELTGASLVITGEGCSDEQTVCGKLCACVAQAAHAVGVPVMLFSGALRGDTRSLEAVFDGCYSIASGPGSLENAMASTAENLRRAGANVARIAGKL
ncbi:MAG: glycerate kinase [Lentisphaeria bacterium]|nr:glycerate kinase [Lentisphaeria bacterium]